MGLLVGTGILCYAALACTFQLQQEAVRSWLSQGLQLGWLHTMTPVLSIALMLVGLLLGLMGTFMGLPRLGVAAAIPVALTMAAIAVACASFLHGEGEPLVALALFSAMAIGFLQMSLVPILSAIAGGVGPASRRSPSASTSDWAAPSSAASWARPRRRRQQLPLSSDLPPHRRRHPRSFPRPQGRCRPRRRDSGGAGCSGRR